MQDKFGIFLTWAKRRWWLLMLAVIGLVIVTIVVLQLVYPADKLLGSVTVDGIDVGGKSKQEAIKILDSAYADKQVKLFASGGKEPVATAKLSQMGVTVSNQQRVEGMNYPWQMRLIPTSMWWYGRTIATGEVKYSSNEEKIKSFAVEKFGEECLVAPKDPSVKVIDNKLTVVKGEDGGQCEMDDVVENIAKVQVELGKPVDLYLDMTPLVSGIDIKEMENLVAIIEGRMSEFVPVGYNGQTADIEASEVRNWLVFDTSSGKLLASIGDGKSEERLEREFGSRANKSAGVTLVETLDFSETKRKDGASGQAIDFSMTNKSIVDYLMGLTDIAQVSVREVPPRVEYKRKYSPTNDGLSAVIANFAKDKPGIYGVSLIELSGQRRRAGYDDTKQFATASTYKVYVAYSVLKRVEAGQMKWTDEVVAGRNVEKCFNDMISLSDNPCAEAFVEKIRYTPLHVDVTEDLGLKKTSFIDKESFKTTAGDLSQFMALLESGQLPISRDNRTNLISALKNNAYRQGIPAGTSGSVANKVGFIDGLLHDTAIVYSPNGTYVLTIMTDKSSWASIAELTKEIEKVRSS